MYRQGSDSSTFQRLMGGRQMRLMGGYRERQWERIKLDKVIVREKLGRETLSF